jgi:imidazolonepropionase-like amidohydrolase
LEGNAFYSVDNTSDIDRAWSRFLKSEPDAVKVYLYHSEDYDKAPAGKHLGLRPELMTDIVYRARQAGLRSLAHIESARDFHNALAAGVDVIMHIPGYYLRPSDIESDYLIQDSDARIAALSNTAVVTTIAITERATDKQFLGRARAVQIENLRRLKRAGVRLAIGTDDSPGRFFAEVSSLASSGTLTNGEILQMMTNTSPRLVFPARQIGTLSEGYEASFLVLDSNPLENIEAASHIRAEVKRGQLVPEVLYSRSKGAASASRDDDRPGPGRPERK